MLAQLDVNEQQQYFYSIYMASLHFLTYQVVHISIS